MRSLALFASLAALTACAPSLNPWDEGWPCAAQEDCVAGFRCLEGACRRDDGREPIASLRDGGAAADAGTVGSEDAGLDEGDAGLDEGDAGADDAGAPLPSAPAFLSLSSTLAHPGGELFVGGRFPGPVSASFAGSEAAALALEVVPGALRIEVPDDARSGALRLTLEGQGAPVVMERALSVVSYAQALQPFEAHGEQAPVARLMPRLLEARARAGVVVSGPWLYVLGGEGAGGEPLATLERARVNADGSLGAFAPAGALVTARAGAAVVRAGDFIYVVGGRGADGALSSVERARVSADGSLGPFSALPEPLQEPRQGAAAAVLGDELLVLGGEADDGPTPSVQRARLLDDGALGPFGVLEEALLLEARTEAVAFSFGPALYVVGGRDASGAVASVELSRLSGGRAGAFEPVPSAELDVARAGAALVVADGQVLVLGGYDGAGERLASTSAAVLDGEQGLLPFAAGASLALALAGAGATLAKDRVVVVGGSDAAGPTGLVQSARLHEGTSAPAGMAPLPVSLASGQSYGSVFVSGDWLYLIGGVEYSPVGDNTELTSVVRRARVFPDGSLGAFAVAGLIPRRAYHCTAVAHGFVYLAGGAGPDFTPLNDVVRAPIAADGSVGDFSPLVGVSLAEEHFAGACAALGDRLHLFGGQPSEGDTDGAQAALFSGDGDLESFALTPDLALTRPRGFVRAVAHAGRLVIAGGTGSTLGTVDVGTISPAGELSPFASLDVGERRWSYAAAVVGPWLYLLSGRRDGQSLVPGAARFSLDEPTPTLAAVPPAVSQARLGASAVVLEDRLLLLGGWTADESTLSVEETLLR